MLKWAVNSRRGEAQVPPRLSLESSGALDGNKRRSLAGPHGRRRNRRSLHNMDKENVDFIGCTPGGLSHKDLYGLRKLEFNSGALKDVSNLTPKSPTPNSPNVRISTPNQSSSGRMKSGFGLETRFAVTPTTCMPRSVIPSQPFLKKRRIILDTDIYVDGSDMENDVKDTKDETDENVTEIVINEKNSSPNNSIFSNNNNKCSAFKNSNENLLAKVVSKESLIDTTEIQRFCVDKPIFSSFNNLTSSTIHHTSEPTFEIEYSPCKTNSNFIGKPSIDTENDMSSSLTTLPRIFMRNPLYFNTENVPNPDMLPPSKRSKIDFTDNFSALLNKLSPLSALRNNGCKDRMRTCSEVSPLARKMASLCFNRLNPNTLSPDSDPNECRANKTPLRLKKRKPLLATKDEEVSIELETKRISNTSTCEDESTITDSKMGDVTLERMIEDILKSTKKVRRARKLKIHQKHPETIVNKIKTSDKDVSLPKHESPPLIEIPKSPLVEDQSDQKNIRTAIIKSTKENISVSFNENEALCTVHSCLEQEKTYILYDPLTSNEREVRTPENRLETCSANASMETVLKNCFEKCTLATTVKSNPRKRCNSLGFTPTLNSSAPHDFNLKRQRCVRRKRVCHRESFEDLSLYRDEIKESCLTLKTGIPSPFTPENKSLSRLLQSRSFNSITGYPFLYNPGEEVEYLEKSGSQILEHQISSPTLNYLNFRDEPVTSVSTSSLMLGQISMGKKSSSTSYASSKMFGLTLECGIPSPSSPFVSNRYLDDFNIETPGFCSSFLTDSSIQKGADDSTDIFSEPATPVVEFRSSRRCLTYSPDDDDLRNIDMFGNFNSARSRQGVVQTQNSMGMIDLSIHCEDDQISVHIIRCRNLQRSNGSTRNINAYVKVSVSGMGSYQRTPVLRDCSSPIFDRHLVLDIPPRSGGGRRIQVSVWHRDSQKRRSEFLGCMSFPVRHALRRALSGPFRLQAARPPRARATGMAAPAPSHTSPSSYAAHNTHHHHHQNAVDDAREQDTGSAIASRLASGQREADEHLFLRYLELDPVEGPESGPAAVQRKASGKSAALGRTPFTTTRRLDRGTEQGFGFSVLWTRPPRVERVDSGRAADRAGLYPGDYIVFVDRHNIVTMPESQVLNLIKSSGTQLVLETFRRSHGDPRPPMSMSRLPRGSVTSHATLSDAAPYSPAPLPRQLVTRLAAATAAEGNRPSTACSNNTARSEAAATSVASKKRPMLSQVAFTRESLSALGGPTVSGPGELGRALHALVAREQHYAQALHFGVERFVAPLASRTDILTANEHKLLFQNCEELLRLSEDILEQLVSEDGEINFHLIASVYLSKMPTIISLYKSYCNGLKRADCVLVQKSRQQGGGFTRLCTEPAIPSRRPDITQFLHKPLEQFRELLRLLRTANSVATSASSDYRALAKLVADLQNAYAEVTAGAGLMGPIGEGRPLLSVGDLESRLVFTRCKPFVLAKPGRQWIFGGDLVRVEGRSCRSHWALLFTDLLLFATVSRDRVLFITEEPLLIANIAETCFNIRKRPTEFRIGVGSGRASSPTARCGPPVKTRTRTIILRAPTADLKAVWQTLLLRQILRVNSSNGTPLSSPLESPAPLGCYSEVTLDSQQHQVPTASTISTKNRHRPLENRLSDSTNEARHHSVSFASTGAVYDSISKLSVSGTNIRSTIEEECKTALRSFEMLTCRINEEPLDPNSNENQTRQTNEIQNGTKTPETPPPNISPSGESSKYSQTFSSHFVSLTSLEKTETDNCFQRQDNSEAPSSPSAVLTPSTTDYNLMDPRKTDHYGDSFLEDEDPEVWDSDGLCRWESFEADLALTNLNLDPSFKTDVEENIYFREDFLPFRKSRDSNRHNPSPSYDL